MDSVAEPTNADPSLQPEVLRLHGLPGVQGTFLLGALIGVPFVVGGMVCLFQALAVAVQTALGTPAGPMWLRGIAGFLPGPELGTAIFYIFGGAALAYAYLFAQPGNEGKLLCLGALYLYKDRLTWQFLWWTRGVYFSGVENVRCGTAGLVLCEGGARVRIPYPAFQAPDYERFHDLLCQRSEPYRRALELQLPCEVPRARGAGVWMRLAIEGSIAGTAAMVLASFPWGVSHSWLWLLCIPLVTLPQVLTFYVTARSWRFESDCISFTGWSRGRRRLDPWLMQDIRLERGVLHLIFSGGVDLEMSQFTVSYPIALLQRYLKELYRLQLGEI